MTAVTVLQAFARALQKVERERVYHPELGVQERVLCYELYHQLRLLEEGGEFDWHPASIQGELNKQAQHLFREEQAIPDFLVHQPGSHDHNLAVVEVKRASAPWNKIDGDVRKLARFADQLHYEERILVVFNSEGEGLDEIREDIVGSYVDGDTTLDVLFYDVRDGTVDHRQITYPAQPLDAARHQAG